MNDNTEKLIRELSDKLGTTADHLWHVLVKQAPITVWLDISQCALLILLMFLAVKGMKILHKKYDETNDLDHPVYVAGWFATVILASFTLFAIVSSVNEIPTAIFNPEYWALKQIIK